MTKRLAAILLTASITAALTGCSGMIGSAKGTGDAPKTRESEAARADASELSNQVMDIINLHGKVTEPAPGVSPYGDRDFEKFYQVDHPWSLYNVPVPDMEKAMNRLRSELPKYGWEITKYGTDSSRAKSLELTADHAKKKFSINITLLDRRGRDEDPSMIAVSLGSACFQVPEGKKVVA